MTCSLGAKIGVNAILAWYAYDVKGSVQLFSRDSYLHVLQIEGKPAPYLFNRLYLFKPKTPSIKTTALYFPAMVKNLHRADRLISDHGHASSLTYTPLLTPLEGQTTMVAKSKKTSRFAPNHRGQGRGCSGPLWPSQQMRRDRLLQLAESSAAR